MNELINELAEQAKKYALDAMIKITDKEQALNVYSETYDTKFAELIIQELIDSMIKRYGDDDELPIQEIKLFAKEHFGVEE